MIGSGLAGLIFHGPISHAWFGWLDTFVVITLGLTQWWNIFPMIIMDCFMFNPLWNAIYVGFMSLVFKNKLKTVFSDIKSTSLPLLQSGLKLWLPANYITYAVVPIHLRVLWSDCAEFVWCIMMSKKTA